MPQQRFPQRKQKTKSSPGSSPDESGAQPQPSLRTRALRMLSRREYTRQELQNRLAVYSEDGAELAALLDDLTAKDWLSDARFAAALVRRRQEQYGARAIRQKLKQAGVSAETADAVLADIESSDEIESALALWRRKFSALPADEKQKARQVRFLLARGYSLSVALRVLKAAASQTG